MTPAAATMIAVPLPDGASRPALAEVKVENFMFSFVVPQYGHSEFFQSVEDFAITLALKFVD
jgi:hypothetical protein